LGELEPAEQVPLRSTTFIAKILLQGRLRGARFRALFFLGMEMPIANGESLATASYMLPEGSRKYFGSLLVGYQGPDGLLFAGRVGETHEKMGFHQGWARCIDQLEELLSKA
jgi:hypothetical protein